MGALHIISGILLTVACIAIVLVVLFTDTKNSGLTSAFGGANTDSFFGKNAKNTRDAKIDKATTICVIVFFAVTLVVNVITALVG